MQSDRMKETINTNTEIQINNVINENMGSAAVQKELNAAAEGAKKIIDLKTQLDSYNEFYTGLITYTSGVAAASSGADALKNGADELKDGTSKLYTGADEICKESLQ